METINKSRKVIVGLLALAALAAFSLTADSGNHSI